MSLMIKQGNMRLTVKWILSVAIPVAILLIPKNDVFTQQVSTFIACSLWLILCAAFELFPSLFIPAFLLPLLYVLTGTCSFTTAYSSWTAEILFVIIGAFVLAAVLEESGLLKRVAYWVILRTGGTFKGVYYGIFLVSFLIAVITFGNAYIFTAAFAYGIVRGLGLGRSREAALITFASALGCKQLRLFIWSPATAGLITGSVQAYMPDFAITLIGQFIHLWPIALCSILTAILIYYLFGGKQCEIAGGADFIRKEYESLGKMPSTEKKAGVILLMVALYMVTQPLHGLNMNYGFLIFPMFYFFPGMKVGTIKSIQSVDFGMIFFVSSCMAIGIVGSAVGIGTILTNALVPLLAPFGPTIASFGIVLFGIAVNFVLTPTAMLGALPGPLVAIAQGLGMDPLPLVYGLLLSTDLIFLPYEYVPYLIFFSFGMMSTNDFLKLSLVKIGVALVFILIVLLPYWKLIGLL